MSDLLVFAVICAAAISALVIVREVTRCVYKILARMIQSMAIFWRLGEIEEAIQSFRADVAAELDEMDNRIDAIAQAADDLGKTINAMKAIMVQSIGRNFWNYWLLTTYISCVTNTPKINWNLPGKMEVGERKVSVPAACSWEKHVSIDV